MPNSGMIMPIMGMSKKAATPLRNVRSASLADALFSGTQQRVLAWLFGQPERSFYATELIGLAGAGSGAVQRELARLAQSGLVTVRTVGNQKHYQANSKAPIYAELCGIVQKTVGLAGPLSDALAPLAARIRAAFVYGSIARREDTASSDIDLMLVSDDLAYSDLYAQLEAVGSRLGRTVNPTIYTPQELAGRVERKDAFVTRVLAQPKLWLIGGEDALGL